MNKRYDKYLTAKYAPLYKDRFSPMTHTAMCWGFEIDDGWFNIINSLSALLCSNWLEAKRNYNFIKDREGDTKYGGEPEEYNKIITANMIQEAKAAMDLAEKNTPVATQVKEKFGTLRFYVSGATDEQYNYIRFAEIMSSVTCQVCGNKGKRTGRGWISTKCKKHKNSDF
jgi:hypothetical protein